MVARPAVGLLAGIAALVTVATFAFGPRTERPSALPVDGSATAEYVDDAACAACHPSSFAAWVSSHHAKAMQVATPETVRGNFNGGATALPGAPFRFHRQRGRFFVEAVGPDGRPQDFEVTHTFGVEPLQQYLVPIPGGRLQALTTAWDGGRRRWFLVYPDAAGQPDDPRAWTSRQHTWNRTCAECHTTNLRKGYDVATDTYATTWSGLGVGCQACHGPGSVHVDRARRSRTRGGGEAPAGGPSTGLARSDSRAEVDACAACHSRRVRLVEAPRPGAPLLDGYRPEVLRQGLYLPDGQQLGEVYEYGSFRQSRMYERGVRCTDCHEPHGGRLRAEGNQLCTRCHQPQPDPRLPTPPARLYDAPSHHFHPAGARCIDCHMRERIYMVIDPRRDHAFRIPRPDLSALLGTPDPCTACHRDRSSRWAAAAIRRWYGASRPGAPHYGETLAAGRAGDPTAEGRLVALVRDPGQPGIVRATALELLRGYGSLGLSAMLDVSRDEDPVVRLAAVGGLDRLPASERGLRVSPFLTDPRRAVRVEAARVLSSVPPSTLDAPTRRAFELALAEWRSTQLVMADWAGAWLNLGLVDENLRRREGAEASYLTALRLDPRFEPARMALAQLYAAMGRRADAQRVLREGAPGSPGSSGSVPR